jgi:hypothetical protein
MSDPSAQLPPSLDLPPHLSAQKYFFVCTLTVAAWDTLVLSPRSWRLLKTKEWPFLKIAYHFLRFFMPIEFTIVGVAFFDTKWSLQVSVLSAVRRPGQPRSLHISPVKALLPMSCERYQGHLRFALVQQTPLHRGISIMIPDTQKLCWWKPC